MFASHVDFEQIYKLRCSTYILCVNLNESNHIHGMPTGNMIYHTSLYQYSENFKKKQDDEIVMN